ncbi:MAG TPA: S1 RNA-binding domain-containing protein [Candidatus Avoscillospira avicola]|uniref:S1 RNA-binding domain-containing protein n=1 Tax=Candidatus Avoscillospira avicola TaxID=2840706 RepID=A0A9D1DGS1_9FIRM|nr:S1 RNA-binding domain-containing protein [Candidatus Avoscillospira avicola]
MELTVGAILEGKVKSITKFGAFISLPENQTGMVHISEITHAYVNDIHDHLTEGQDVKVMVIGLDNGKINLSIRRIQPAPPRQPADRRGQGERPRSDTRPPRPRTSAPAERQPQSFDDMLKQFMADSDSKISGLKQYSDRKTKNRRR